MIVSNITILSTSNKRNNPLICFDAFLLPGDQIIPNALEVIDGIKAMVDEAKSLLYL